MKKQILFFSAILIAFLFSSCASNGDEKLKKDIIGTYYHSTMEENDGVIITVEGRETFKASGEIEDKGTLVISMFNEKAGKITLKYDISATGEYNIKNSHIIYDYNLDNIKIEPQKDQKGVDKSVIKNVHSILEEHVIPAVKQDMINDNESQIIELTENKLVVETGGKQHTYKKEK